MRAHVTYGPSAEELAAEVESKDLALIRAVLEAAAKAALCGPQTIGAANGETKWPSDWTGHHNLAYAERRGENQMAQHNYETIRALSPQSILEKVRAK